MLNMLEIWSRFEFTNENREPSEKHVFSNNASERGRRVHPAPPNLYQCVSGFGFWVQVGVDHATGCFIRMTVTVGFVVC